MHRQRAAAAVLVRQTVYAGILAIGGLAMVHALIDAVIGVDASGQAPAGPVAAVYLLTFCLATAGAWQAATRDWHLLPGKTSGRRWER